MVLSDFLSRQQGDNSDPHQIIPISFNMKEILKRNYQNIVKDTFMIQTRSQTKSRAPTVQGATKSSNKRRKEIKPVVINDTPTIIDSDDKLQIDIQTQNTKTRLPCDLTRPGVRQTAAYSHLIIRSPPRPPDLVDKRNYRTDTGIDQI